MKILVTGGAGYIGSVVTEELLNRYHSVIVIDNLQEGNREAVLPEAVFYEGNFGDGKLLNEIFENHRIDAVLHFDVDAEVLMQRMIGRLTCISCGSLFNLFTQPSAIDDKCDHCGGTLHHRADDNEEIIERRLHVFETLTQPLNDYYKQKGILHILEAHGDVEEVTKRVKSALRGLRPKRTPVKPMLAAVPPISKHAKPAVTHTRVETPTPKIRPRKKIKTISGNTTVKKLEIKKVLPQVIRKKSIKAAKKKASTTKASISKSKSDTLDATLDKQLKQLEKELKQTKAQLKQASDAEKALLKAEK